MERRQLFLDIDVLPDALPRQLREDLELVPGGRLSFLAGLLAAVTSSSAESRNTFSFPRPDSPPRWRPGAASSSPRRQTRCPRWGDDDSALRGFLLFNPFNQDSIMERIKFHFESPSEMGSGWRPERNELTLVSSRRGSFTATRFLESGPQLRASKGSVATPGRTARPERPQY